MNTQDEDNLIIKFLAGEATEAERIQLDTWRSSDPLHEDKFLQSQTLWKRSTRTELDLDTDAAWANVKAKLRTPAQTRTFGQYLRIAAAILVLCTAGWFAVESLYNPMIHVQTAANEQKEVILPDGSQVWLNESSDLSYPKQFKGKHRDVELSGEAFFEVVKNPEQPFVITSSQVITEVLGTSFNLYAPAESKEATLDVVTGKVRFTSTDNTTEVVVVAGEKAELTTVGDATKAGAANENAFAWKSGKLVFNDNTLKEVFDVLQHQFKINITTENPEILNCHFTGTFSKQDKDEVLDIICRSLQLKYTRKGKNVTVQGKGCTQ
jgi:ferric-dicitrate binding protein FerR (iron transport regulator)